jgi:hypothetical protein
MAGHARARVLAAREEWEPASSHFAEARRAFQDIHARYEAARCLLGQSNALSTAGLKPVEASELARQASAELQSLGAAAVES